MMIESAQSSWFYHVIYIMNSQAWYVFYRSSTGAVELACRMLQHPGILCGVPADFRFFLPDGFHLVRNWVSCQADDALEVCQSAGTWSTLDTYPTRYLRDA